MDRYLQFAGGPNAHIVIFPMASSIPDTVGFEEAEDFLKAGVKSAISLNLTRKQADTDSALRLLDGVTGVFFSGGDQSRLTAALKNTKIEKRLHELYQSGIVIGGTSAGAAVMSKIMLTGNEKINRDSNNAYIFIKPNNIETAEGFGFIDKIIVDQHFIKRKRHNRLLSLALEHPQLLCFGIDESTALIVRNGSECEIAGEATVMVIDAVAAKEIRTNKQGHFSATDIRIHLLTEGDTMNLTTNQITHYSR